MCSNWSLDVCYALQRLKMSNANDQRGAKTAMTVALRSPESVSALIPVDNAPVNASLKSDFPKYVRGMQEIENAKVTKQSEANKILEAFEEVSIT